MQSLLRTTLVIGVATILFCFPAFAQKEGNGQWSTVTATVGVKAYYDSPIAACERQWQEFNAMHPASRFRGATYYDPIHQLCDWTTFQNGCSGGGVLGGINDCGTVLPTLVSFECGSGYKAMPG
jgi:hypothetical protein